MNRGTLYVIGAILLWSSQGIVVRYAGVGVHVLVFYANTLSLLFLAPLALGSGRRMSIPKGKGSLKLLVLGPLTLLNTLTFLYALQNTTISNALMTHYIAPVAVAVLAAIFLGETFTARIFSALILSSLGLWVMLVHGGADLISSGSGTMDLNSLGIISGLASGIFYAVVIVSVRVLAPAVDPIVLVFFQNLVMCILLAPFIREFPIDAAWSFPLMGIVHGTIAPLLYVSGLRTVQANTTAILGYLEPVCAILLGVVILREVPGILSLLGGVLILVSGLIVLRGEEKKKAA